MTTLGGTLTYTIGGLQMTTLGGTLTHTIGGLQMTTLGGTLTYTIEKVEFVQILNVRKIFDNNFQHCLPTKL